jgi:UrcA family protein
MNTDSPRTDEPRQILLAATCGAAAALIAFAAVVAAQEHSAKAPETLSANVSLADLDLTTPQGERVARERLQTAATRLCNTFGDTRRVSNAATVEACTRDALNDALSRLNVRRLAAADRKGPGE